MTSETIPLPGTLYVVATPIGNLADITYRAVAILAEVQLIATEDTRHSMRLLQHYGIKTPCIALHDHNERQRTPKLIERLERGDAIALISDAGTPLISDPGFGLVKTARERGLPVVPVPGPSAVLAALSVAGIPVDRFCFEGFLPAKSGARRKRLQELNSESRTLVFYESPHRITAALQQMKTVFGGERRGVVARELTKTFETIHSDSLENLLLWIAADDNQRRGEFVLLVEGAQKQATTREPAAEASRVAEILSLELPPGQAAALAAKITGEKKSRLYRHLLGQNRRADTGSLDEKDQ